MVTEPTMAPRRDRLIRVENCVVLAAAVEPTDKIEGIVSASGATAYVALLFCFDSDLRVHPLRGEGDSCVIGRCAPAEIVVGDPTLSRIHARFSLHNGRVLLEDLGSTNGAIVNGERIKSAQLAEGDVALLGSVEVRVAGRAALSAGSRAISHRALLARLEDEVTRARLYGRHVAVAALKHEHDPTLCESLLPFLAPLDHLCSFAPTVTLVLLAEVDERAARVRCERLLTELSGPACIGVASYPGVPANAQELVSLALDVCHTVAPGCVRVAGQDSVDATQPMSPVVTSPLMLKLYELVAKAARTMLPVLIQGQTGTGKELIARALHDLGPRRKEPFKALNCGAIPAPLVEGLLFGHERGAYTGADRQMPGLFEQTQGGTLFLDEVGELPLPAQAALLRVLEQRSIVRLGGTREIPVDVRIVAATHRDLRAMVRGRAFREDLLFRLDALTLDVPPLRARREEIAPLALGFLARARAQWGAHAQRLSPEAIAALEAYAYPGNVRELKNAIERAAVLCVGEEIRLDDLPPQLWGASEEESVQRALEPEAGGPGSLTRRLREFEAGVIREALERAKGNQSQAARMLDVPRRTFAHKAHAYGLVYKLAREASEG